jgi:small subunit ribosomal protein S21
MKHNQGRAVLVQDGNIDKALRKLKKKIAASGVLMELQDRQTYIKPSVRRKLAKAVAKKRWKKHLEKQQLPPKQY